MRAIYITEICVEVIQLFVFCIEGFFRMLDFAYKSCEGFEGQKVV